MTFMVIESFKHGDPRPAGERLLLQGRMLPEGVAYHASSMESNGARCFQVMEAASPEILHEWIHRWDDVVDFEIVPVLPSADYWTRTQSQ